MLQFSTITLRFSQGHLEVNPPEVTDLNVLVQYHHPEALQVIKMLLNVRGDDDTQGLKTAFLILELIASYQNKVHEETTNKKYKR